MSQPASRPFLVSAKQPPHSIEAEQSVLGGLMLSNRAFLDVAEKISASDFYRSDHQLIFTAIGQLIGANEPCDFVTLSERLRKMGRLDEAGGVGYLGTLAVDTYSVSNIVSYADIVRERSVMRGLIAAGSDIGDLGYRPEGRNTGELLDAAEHTLFKIQQRRTRPAQLSNDAILQRIAERIEKKVALQGLPTGFVGFDQRTQGLHPGDLVIIAARPGKGKTVLACNIAQHLAVDGRIPVGVFSMEMTAERLMLRFLAAHGRIELSALRSGQLTDADFNRLVSADAHLRAAPLHIDETGALSPLELRARARRMVTKLGVKLVIVDYLQLMQIPGSRENRTNDVSEISRQLKTMAKELGIPVIALSQLSREVDKRVGKRPSLADLRESGQIEADADIVAFIHRDENFDDPNKAEIIIGKHRDGPTGDFKLTWLGQYCRFDNPQMEYA